MDRIDKLDLIKERCEKQGLQTRVTTRDIEIYDEETDSERVESRRQLIISIPAERDFKNIVLVDGDEINRIEKSNFEKFRFIKGYEAVWSEELKTVEGEIQSDDSLRSSRLFMRLLLQLFDDQSGVVKSEANGQLNFPSPNGKLKITVGNCSAEYSILSGLKREFLFMSRGLATRLTLRIENAEVKTHNDARDLLIKIANSVLFQIDLSTDVPVHLALDRDLLRGIRRKKALNNRKVKFNSPRYQYDGEAMSLYWYARTAVNMPLLQFLAFYQILEFYFPSFSYAEAQQKIKNLIKNPLFDANKDTDVAQIINIIKLSAKGKAIGDERTQLKATINSVVDNATLVGYLTDVEERKDFFDVSKKTKGLAKQKISFASSENDIRAEIANRVYEIRCRIVHTKDDEELALILPFSVDLLHLKHDLDLIEFLARQTIIATSQPLRLE